MASADTQTATLRKAIEDSMGGCSEAELRSAFERVENKTHWKMPIDAIVKPSEKRILSFAIPFFAGCVPTFTKATMGRIRVQAVGYYLAIGA